MKYHMTSNKFFQKILSISQQKISCARWKGFYLSEGFIKRHLPAFEDAQKEYDRIQDGIRRRDVENVQLELLIAAKTEISKTQVSYKPTWLSRFFYALGIDMGLSL